MSKILWKAKSQTKLNSNLYKFEKFISKKFSTISPTNNPLIREEPNEEVKTHPEIFSLFELFRSE